MKTNTLNSAEFVKKLRHGDGPKFLDFVRETLEKSQADPEVVRKMADLFKLDQQIYWDDIKSKTIMRVVNLLPNSSLKQSLTKIINYYHSQMLDGIVFYLDLLLYENDLRLKAEADLKILKNLLKTF